jgi:4-diphosphocytidyl-2-C-methyl-D-erythritol kinase
VTSVTVFAPAKLNLFLAITGRRPDGFHELVSLAAPVNFGDQLTIDLLPNAADKGRFELTCSDPTVPCDETNLVLRAARAFAPASGWSGGAKFVLEKRIPVGAGLGGGSSDAVATLRGLNRLAGNSLSAERLREIAATVGSDCPLFLHDGPVVMRGRGERIEPLPPAASARLRGREVLIFKPEFGVPTAWAYAELAREAPAGYVEASVAEARLRVWGDDSGAPAERLLFNSMERVAFAKFVALPVLQEQLQRQFGLVARMSGSGSACFAFMPSGAPVGEIVSAIRAAWGESAFAITTRLL